MSVFADTSGFLALANAADAHHPEASRIWRSLLLREEEAYTTNYVLVETVALLHHRFGIPAVRRFCEDLVPVLTVDWVDAEAHAAAVGAVIAGGRRGPTLVDCSSFEMMRRRGLTAALAFDRHFRELGYRLPAVEA